MSVYTSVVIGLEYLYEAAMEYLNGKYHNYDNMPTGLPRDYTPDPVILAQIQEGASAATWAAAEYSGPTGGNVVI